MARKKLPARNRRGITDYQITPSVRFKAGITTSELYRHEELLRFTLDPIYTGTRNLDPLDPMTFRSREQNRISDHTKLSPLRTSNFFIEQVLPEDPAAMASILPQDSRMKVSQ